MKINFNNIGLIMIALCVEASGVEMHYAGALRAGYQYHDSQENEGSDMAVGGMLHAQSLPQGGVSFGMSVQTSQVIGNQNSAFAVPFFDAQADSYALLSEAYIKGEFDKSTVILGRQRLDTPFLDSDDIGMVPNSFEAYSLINHDIDAVTLFYAYVRNMAGIDASTPEKFEEINGKSGVHILGVEYEPLAQFSLSGWFYAMPTMAQYSYLEAHYEGKLENFSYTLSGQATLQDFRNQEDTKIVGFSTAFMHDKSGLGASVAYNKSYGGIADTGFGGGPFFTSSEHMTLADSHLHGDIVLTSLSWDVNTRLSCTLSRASMHDAKRHDGDEVDGVVHYEVADNLSFDAIYSKIDNTDVSGDKFDNLRLFANYSF